MDSTGVAAALALTAGLFGAVQVAVMGRLGERIGSLEAVMLAAIVTGVIVMPVLLVARRGFGGLGDTFAQPWWMLTGGALGAAIVLSITIAGPRIGVVATTAFLIAAQFALAAVIDRYGWFGVERVALTWPRVLGLGLLIAGAALTLRR